jgi:hypothetical protein
LPAPYRAVSIRTSAGLPRRQRFVATTSTWSPVARSTVISPLMFRI